MNKLESKLIELKNKKIVYERNKPQIEHALKLAPRLTDKQILNQLNLIDKLTFEPNDIYILTSSKPIILLYDKMTNNETVGIKN